MMRITTKARQQRQRRASCKRLTEACVRYDCHYRWIWLATTAAATAALQQHPFAMGFVIHPVKQVVQHTPSSSFPSSYSRRSFHSTTKLQMSGGGFLDSLKNAAMSILPKKWFQSEQERQAEEERKLVEKEIKGGLTQILKDAPLPIRMLGRAMTPLFGSALSVLAEAAQEQQATVSTVLTQASNCIYNDPAVIRQYGKDVQLSAHPFSQSTSTSIINGQQSTRVELLVSIAGSLDSGVATILANQNGVQSIRIQSNAYGRTLSVSTTPGSRSSKGTSGWSDQKQEEDDIIEAEIIEKTVDKRNKKS